MTLAGVGICVAIHEDLFCNNNKTAMSMSILALIHHRLFELSTRS